MDADFSPHVPTEAGTHMLLKEAIQKESSVHDEIT
jgi:hypothetical protein